MTPSRQSDAPAGEIGVCSVMSEQSGGAAGSGSNGISTTAPASADPYTWRPMTIPSPSARARLRIGIAGLGAVAQAVHLPLLARLAHTVEIAALCGLSPGLLAALGDRYLVPADARFESVDALLDGASIEGL